MKNLTILLRLYRITEIRFLRSGLSFMMLLSLMTCLSCSAKIEKSVKEAFELRINGKTDQAKEILLAIIKEDSTNAAAQFELARTLDYINIMGSEEATKALSVALKYDPENVVYTYYNARACFLKAYIAMEREGGNVKNLINDVCNEYVKVLNLKPDYPEALMYLVEIYGMLPENMGGDKIKAEEYTQKLEKLDKFYGAKARLILMPEGTDMVKYWNNLIVENDKDYRAWKELGVANIFNENIEAAKENFEKAIALDNSQNIRLLDLSRYHQMKVMQNREAAEKELPEAKKYIKQYLASVPEPIPPLKAYAIGTLAKFEMFSGNNAEAEKLMQEAKSLDPYFSRAFGIPSLALFEPADKLDRHFSSFFSPY